MNSYQERVFQSLRRVQGWFAANPQYAAGNPSLANQLGAFNGIVSRLSDHATAQETQLAQTLLISKDEIGKRREVLVHQMAPIAKVARALRATVPGIGVLTLPKGNVSTPELIALATAMAQQAVVYKDVLVESGLPADVIEQLEAAAAALKASLDGRGLARASRAAATQGVGNEVVLGLRMVMILDAVITRVIHSDPVKLAEWEQLKRVTAKGGVVRGRARLVDGSSKAGDTSSSPSQSSSTHVETSSTSVQTSPTDVVAAPTTGSKAA